MQLQRRGIAVILRSALVLAVIAINAFIIEVGLRAIDGFRIASFRLTRQHLIDLRTPPLEMPTIPLADGIRREWFGLSPPSYERRPHPGLAAYADRYAWNLGRNGLSYVFNSNYAERLCTQSLYRGLPIVFLFDPPSIADSHPRYRFPLNTVLPSGLTTNQFGWRGGPIELHKPANAIRVAFVGASTTVNGHDFPFSYPELVGFWLDLWARENFGVRVEAINAGREGIASSDIAAVVRDELLPLDPDLVVYYEGSNQFSPRAITKFSGAPAVPKMTNPSRLFLNQLALYSATLQRALNIFDRFSLSGDEPERPAYDVVWPADVNEYDPPIDHPGLPANLSVIVRDLDSIKAALETQGATLVPTSFFWLVYDGMKFEPGRHQGFITYLGWFPYRYREMERMAAFQNRVLSKYALSRGLPFLDVAAAIPREPDYYTDPIHATYPGVRRHAWIVTQQLAPILRDRIERKLLPRPYRLNLDAHPAFPGNERTARFDCRPDESNLTSVGHADLTAGIDVQLPAIVKAGSALEVRVPAKTRLHHYLVMIRLPQGETPQRGQFLVKAKIKVTEGNASIGILTADRKHFVAYQKAEATEDFVTISIPFDVPGQAMGPLVITAGTPRNNEVTITVRDIEVLAGTLYRFPTTASGIKVPH
jgi:hypothetical protein